MIIGNFGYVHLGACLPRSRLHSCRNYFH